MNRVIKFRAKQLRSPHWCYGAFIPASLSSWDDDTIFDGNFRKAIDTDTLGQYTGYKDKYGTEIYEGDILEDLSENTVTYKRLRMIVRFGEFNALEVGLLNLGFYVDIPVDKGTSVWSKSLMYWLSGDGMRVIGNIFDNPELLDGDTK